MHVRKTSRVPPPFIRAQMDAGIPLSRVILDVPLDPLGQPDLSVLPGEGKYKIVTIFDGIQPGNFITSFKHLSFIHSFIHCR